MNWTEKHRNGLTHTNRILAYQAKVKAKGYSGNNVVPDNRSKALVWLEFNLSMWANSKALTLERNYRYDKTNKFDFCFPALKIAIDGNGAKSSGWKVISFNELNYSTVLKTLNEMVK